LGFQIEEKTELAIGTTATLLQKIASERIRDEFIRILMSENPMMGFNLCRKLNLIKYLVPELEQGIGVDQNQAHSYDVWEHTMRAVQHGAEKKWSLDVRLATLFHDIGKPVTRLWSNEKKDWTFHGHDMAGAKITAQAMARLRFSKKEIEKTTKLVRWHMFFSDTELITLSAVRRIVTKVGKENMDDLMKVRMCDRIGTGRPKESPYRLRKYQSMVEEVMRDPISVSMLAIGGEDIMRVTSIQPGPKIGYILNALLEEVLEDPKQNTVENLEKMAKILANLSDTDLKKVGETAKEKRETEEEKEINEIRKKYWVK
jgi:poly(A) polymerase/tRNA nucleotidyltransferase (CCA-adding enzyme)